MSEEGFTKFAILNFFFVFLERGVGVGMSLHDTQETMNYCIYVKC